MSLFLWFSLLFSDVDVAEHMAARQAVREAFKAGDQAALLEQARRCHQAFPQNFLGRYYLTVALSLNGHTVETLAQLNAIADMGYDLDVGKDPSFKQLTEQPAYAAVAQKFAANRQLIDHSTAAFTIDQPDLFPEGLVFDPGGKRYFISSIHQRKIISRDARGTVTDWLAFDPAKPGLLPFSILGLTLSRDGKSLWVTSACMDQTKAGCGDMNGRSALMKLRLKDGKSLGVHFFGDAENPSVIGEVISDKRGVLYLSDSTAGVIYRKPQVKDKGETWQDQPEPWLRSPLLRSPQGLALSADESLLYVADYSFGLLVVDIATKTIQPLSAPANLLTSGGDGLVRYKNHLILIQNGVKPHRVAAFQLAKNGRALTGQKVLAANHPAFDEPTLGTLVGDTFTFLANSQWGHYDKQFQPVTDNLKPIEYRAIDLKKALP
ncbi:SMP-30/gluconolactonase/LRE family protein [Acanthopleuribacter pedis]|uniref:SMP-30/Gluconolactonase/LRE-like region domain-containing protein n=1 Tax=Acanthopleuribacter pedis TaxID=442870 RepID=A0A8J7U648_9BACT|nr:hypothetical protein [Acanthopleuribacter pedis]MBO1319971.1 hypothetical protein [Acanthopleuribacter pedis]